MRFFLIILMFLTSINLSSQTIDVKVANNSINTGNSRSFSIVPNDISEDHITTKSVYTSAQISSDGSISGSVGLWWGEGESLTYFTPSGISVYGNVTMQITTDMTLSGLKPDQLYTFRWAVHNGNSIKYYSSKELSFITNSNSVPTNILLSNSEIKYNVDIGTQVGLFNSEDIDDGDLFTYSFVEGSGDSGNSFFSIEDNKLLSAVSFLDIDDSSLSIRVQVNDDNGGVFTKSFAITILQNSAPTNILLSNSEIKNNVDIGTQVGLFNSEDIDDGDLFTYSFVEGSGDSGNSFFSIEDNKLLSAVSFLDIDDSSLSIRVQVNDGNDGVFTKSFAITIVHVDDTAPTPITDANIHEAVNTCLSTHPVTGLCTDSEYGSITEWDVSSVTNMDELFFNKNQFNGDISSWDVSSVSDMTYMFYKTPFNQDISSWDVSSVTNMGAMFENSPFNQDISGWCVTNIASEPINFSTNSPLTQSNKPVWGTCPLLSTPEFIGSIGDSDYYYYPENEMIWSEAQTLLSNTEGI